MIGWYGAPGKASSYEPKTHIVRDGKPREGGYAMTTETLARRIADDLFKSGPDNQQARRLVLEMPTGRDGGGWCKQAMRDIIEKHLGEGRLGSDHFKSEGARLERKAMRERLRRQIKKAEAIGAYTVIAWLKVELAWTLARQSRYEPRKGGLGRR